MNRIRPTLQIKPINKTMSIKKLTLTISQDCETKQGQHKIEGKKVTVQFDSSMTVGQVVGAMVDRLFDYIEFAKRRKMLPFKLNHPIQFSILYQDNDWLRSKLTDISVIESRISNTINKKGEQRLANDLKELLGLIMKDSMDRRDLLTIADDGRLSVDAAGRLMCDTKMSKVLDKRVKKLI